MPRQAADSMAEGLRKILTQIPLLATFADADMNFLAQLQMMVTQGIKQAAMAPDMMAGGGGMPPAPPAPTPDMTMGPGPQLGGPPGVSGLRPSQPNIDEMARMLGPAANGAVQ